jgi:hypothetical protein
MFTLWSKITPNNIPDYYCKAPRPPIRREELNTENFGVIGDRNSGKSTFLAKALSHKSDQENALILCTYATQRNFWAKLIRNYNITKTIVHTPDSLARYLLSLWAKKEGKKLEWVLERDALGDPSKRSTQSWRDERGYALWLLKSNRMTAGIAHWLLANEIESFVENKMLPNLDLFCIDEPEEWEPEAQRWVKMLPRTRALIATKSPEYLWENFQHTRQLKGCYDWQGHLSNYRYIKIVPELPKSPELIPPHSCIVFQNSLNTRTLKDFARKNRCELRLAEQIKGRNYNQIYIDCLPTSLQTIRNWATRSKALDYLDLIASRGRTLAVIKEEDNLSYLPLRKENERFLTWKPPITNLKE